MGNWVKCGSCAGTWARPGTVSDYERQAIESRPCPRCGAYTLGCTPPRVARRSRMTRPAATDGRWSERTAA